MRAGPSVPDNPWGGGEEEGQCGWSASDRRGNGAPGAVPVLLLWSPLSRDGNCKAAALCPGGGVGSGPGNRGVG